MSSCYLDASALVKLVTHETVTAKLRAHLDRYAGRSTSRLAAVEVPRALARKGPASHASADESWQQILERLLIVELNAEIAQTASLLEPRLLRSLDAVHLASAISLGDELEAFITYDLRLADAARGAGLTVLAPA